jgi:lantibiotic modifying enzyme
VKILAEGERNNAASPDAKLPDVKAGRIARGLKIFLEKTSSGPVRQGSRQRSSVSLGQILAPAVSFGTACLRDTAPRAAQKFLTESAWDDLGRDLSTRLAFALTPTLHLQQNVTKAIARSLRPIAQTRERRFALDNDTTLLETIIEFPDLLETAAQLISAWINAQRELFARLLRDRADLCSVFLRARQSFRIIHIRARLSDPHDGAKTATMIEFVNRRRVIYKPRSSGGEELWFEALRWLNRNGLPLLFRVPKMLSRRSYFWMEFLQTKDCESPTAVRLFYFRWGAQAALAQILGATDLHRDNWLAVGAQPILVDAELIGAAEPTSFRGTSNSKHRQSLPALLQTGLLPFTSRDRAGFYRGIAPLDATIRKAPPPICWPRYGRVAQEPSRYVNDLVSGFEVVAEVFGSPQTAQRFFREVVLQTAGQNERVLLRATAQYARLLSESFDARNMISAGDRWRHLVRECCASAANRRVGLAEARSLLRCDIPKFTRRRSALPISWKDFSAAIAELKSSSRLLRSRVVLGARPRRA